MNGPRPLALIRGSPSPSVGPGRCRWPLLFADDWPPTTRHSAAIRRLTLPARAGRITLGAWPWPFGLGRIRWIGSGCGRSPPCYTLSGLRPPCPHTQFQGHALRSGSTPRWGRTLSYTLLSPWCRQEQPTAPTPEPMRRWGVPRPPNSTNGGTSCYASSQTLLARKAAVAAPRPS